MRVAVVHEWLVVKAGAEAVLEQILNVFPGADVYTLVNFLSDEDKATLKVRRFFTSFLQKMPFARKRYRDYLPLMPLAVEQFDLSGYDLIISSSYAVAKGVLTGPDQLHISYVHSPMRYAWDLYHSYLRETGLSRGIRGFFARLLLHYIRIWDSRTCHGVDHFIANSKFVSRRIRKIYGRDSEVIYPPVRLDDFQLHRAKDDFYVTASRLVPYKRISLIVEAFSRMPDKKLIVIGDGPEMQTARKKASSNILFMGYQPRNVLVDYVQRARAFIFAAEEDFGIAPVEAQACGTPVIAFGKGGVLETVIDGETGVFFYEQTPDALISAVNRFEVMEDVFSPERIRENVERFDVSVFVERFRSFVMSKVDDAEHGSGKGPFFVDRSFTGVREKARVVSVSGFLKKS